MVSQQALVETLSHTSACDGRSRAVADCQTITSVAAPFRRTSAHG
jgi:hypothetical protein